MPIILSTPRPTHVIVSTNLHVPEQRRQVVDTLHAHRQNQIKVDTVPGRRPENQFDRFPGIVT
jgi:hypothetical protein